MSLLFYRRPDFVKRYDGPLDAMACQRMVAKNYSNKQSLPESVSFDKIIENRTHPPCGLSDFLDYLVYVAHDAENLQFFLWYQDYIKRFDALSEVAKALSPPLDGIPKGNMSEINSSDTIQPNLSNEIISNQPFREEVERIASHYIKAGAVRELNLSSRDRDAVFSSLGHTTHPSIFAGVITLIETTLRNQSHPNFVRWTICNGNKPKVFLVRTMASIFMIIGISLSVVLCLSHFARWWRIFVFLPFFMSIMNFTAAYKGLCIMLHFTGNKREIRPWESLEDLDEKAFKDEEAANSDDGKLQDSAYEIKGGRRSKWLDTFGTRNAEFEKEPWVQRWRNRPLIRKVWEPTTRVYNEGIRIMQDRIIKQSQIWGLMGATVITVAVTALPSANLY